MNSASEAVFTPLHFICDSQMGLKSKTVKVHQAGKAYQGQTVKPIGLIHKLQRKWSVVNSASETVFTTLHFLCNLQMGLIR